MKKDTMMINVCQFRFILTMFVVLVVLTVLIRTISGNKANSDNVLDKVVDNENSVHHDIKRRSASKSIGNLQIHRNGSASISVTHNGRMLHYHGRGVVEGMLQEFFGIFPPEPPTPKPINDPPYSIVNPRTSPLTSSAYTSWRERYGKSSIPPYSPIPRESPSTDSTSYYIPDPETSASGIPRSIDVTGVPAVDPSSPDPNAQQNTASRPFVASQAQRAAEMNYWNEPGPAPLPLSRKPSYVEFFTMMKIPGITSENSGQRFSGYAFKIKDEDRLLLPHFGQQHLKAAPGLAINPSFFSDYHGPNKTLEFISEAIISGMHAQYFGMKRSRMT